MRFKFTLMAAALASTAATAGPDAMTPEEARHFLSRTGFGAAPHEISALVGTSYVDAVDAVLAGLRNTPSTPMPRWATGWAYPRNEIGSVSQLAEELFYANRYLEIEDLGQWWLGEMITTPSPLTERLVLFWHDHFATSFIVDESSQWMAAQNAMFRAHAAGNFTDLLRAVLRDPAMLSYLSNTENFAEAPNENLGREFLELFTLGQGRGYSERDVKEAARALTGHSLSEFGAGYAFYEEDHDRGRKVILGQEGRFDAPDLPRLATQSPDFGPYIVEKLWMQFVSDTPDPDEVQRLTAVWKGAGWDMKPLLRELFLSEAFWAGENRGRLVKSPIELTVGVIRTLGLEKVPLNAAGWAAADMGQALFFPPNVSGWTSGTGWITDANALARATIMNEVVDFEPDSGSPARPMMATRAQHLRTSVADDDLRVGQVFALEAYREDGGAGLLLTLFDVSYGGQTWRSVPLYVERYGREVPELSYYVGDCAPGCLFGAAAPDPSEPWIWAPVSEDYREEGITPTGARFMAMLSAHLPALMDSTQSHRIWSPDMDEMEDYAPLSFRDAQRLADRIARDGRNAFGRPRGELILAQSAPETLGLSGLSDVSDLDDLDAYLEEREESAGRIASPRVTYAGLKDWEAALPRGMAPAQALLPITPVSFDPERSASTEALIADLLRSPEFQLN